MAATEIKGRLRQEADDGGSWQERHVEIQQGILRSRNDSGSQSHKVVLAGKQATVRRQAGGEDFEILVEERIKMRAPSGDEASRWVKALRDQGAEVRDLVAAAQSEEAADPEPEPAPPMPAPVDLTEPVTGTTFPGERDGLLLLGVGPRIKKIGFVEVKVYAAALYVDAAALAGALGPQFAGQSHAELVANQDFYRALVASGAPMVLVLRLYRGVREAQMSSGLAEDLIPRLGSEALWAERLAEQIVGDVAAGEEVAFAMHPGGPMVLTYKGVEKPALDSPRLGPALLNCFMDENPLWQAAKEGLVARAPAVLAVPAPAPAPRTPPREASPAPAPTPPPQQQELPKPKRTPITSEAPPPAVPPPDVDARVAALRAQGCATCPVTGVEFPGRRDGDVLLGVGPRLKRVALMDVRINAVALYVDAEAVCGELNSQFEGRSLPQLLGAGQDFFKAFVGCSARKTLVLRFVRNVSAAQLAAGLVEDLLPRLGSDALWAERLTENITADLAPGDEVAFTSHPAGGPLVMTYKGHVFPAFESARLGRALLNCYLDENPLWPAAKEGLVARMPTLLRSTGSPDVGAGVGAGAVDDGVDRGDALRRLGAMTEDATGSAFDVERDGLLLVGVGPRIKKVGFLEVKVYAAALYVDAAALAAALGDQFAGQSHAQLTANPDFYRALVASDARKLLVLRLYRGVREAQMSSGLAEDLVPRLGSEALWAEKLSEQIVGNVAAGDEVAFLMHPGGPMVLTYKGVEKPPLESDRLGPALLNCFMDENPLWQAAKEGLVARIPALLGSSASASASADVGERKAPEFDDGKLRRLGDMTETVTGSTFPVEREGLLLLGVGPRIKKVGFLEVKVYAAALYVDAAALAAAMGDQFAGQSHAQLTSNPDFYRALVASDARKLLVLRLYRGVREAQMSSGLAEDLVPRLGSEALWAEKLSEQIVGNVAAGDEVAFLMHPGGPMVMTYKGVEKPPLESDRLGPALLNCFLDENPLWQAAKEGLVLRAPALFAPSASASATAAATPTTMIEAQVDALRRLGSMSEPVTNTAFPGDRDGLLLLGVGPRIKKVGFLEIKVYAAALYVDAAALAEALGDQFAGQSRSQLTANPDFYRALVASDARKLLVLRLYRGVREAQMSSGLAEDLVPRLGKEALWAESLSQQIVGDVAAGDEVAFLMHPGGPMVMTYKGAEKPPLECERLGPALLNCFLDDKPLWQAAKEGLVARAAVLLRPQAGGQSADAQADDPSDDDPVLAGWLRKHHPMRIGVMGAKWTPRWCTLEGSRLAYRYDPGDAEPRDSFELTQCTVRAEQQSFERATVLGPEETHFTFSVVHKGSGRTLRLSTDTADEWRKWVQALGAAASMAQPASAGELRRRRRVAASPASPAEDATAADQDLSPVEALPPPSRIHGPVRGVTFEVLCIVLAAVLSAGVGWGVDLWWGE